MPTPLPATVLAWVFRGEPARAMFGGVAAHAFRPLNRPMSSAIGLGILTAGHPGGSAVAAGGFRAITAAMAEQFVELGGKIETGVRVNAASEPTTDVTIFDLAPGAVADILGDGLRPRIARAYRKFRHGTRAFKVDFAVQGGVPWTAEPARRAGTVHFSGVFAEVVATEAAVCAGRVPERPFVLVGQQYLADPQRSAGDVHPVWSYAHVPHGYTGDATEAIIANRSSWVAAGDVPLLGGDPAWTRRPRDVWGQCRRIRPAPLARGAPHSHTNDSSIIGGRHVRAHHCCRSFLGRSHRPGPVGRRDAA
jgi:phytoene dehydrogenase-like protein